MCARWPTIAMSKLFFAFERSFCRCMAVMSCALGWCVCDLTCFQVMWLVVRWFVVLLRYYSVLQRTTTCYSSTIPTYYSILQSTTPVLLCTTKYYNVLLQYYSVLQSTTPVLLCTTKYYSSTTLYYKVLRQYYSVLQSTTRVLLCTTKYYSSTTLYYTVLQCTTLYYKVLRQYYSVLRQYYNVLLRYYFETAFTMRGRRNKSHRPTSPNTAPATQNECHQWSASHMKHHFQCAEQQEAASNFTKYCACHTKWMSPVICNTYETSFPMRGASKVTIQPHQILRLPRNSEVNISTENPWIASANRKTIRR